MYHSKVVYIANHTTLHLGHRTFSVRYTLLQIASNLSLIFATYRKNRDIRMGAYFEGYLFLWGANNCM